MLESAKLKLERSLHFFSEISTTLDQYRAAGNFQVTGGGHSNDNLTLSLRANIPMNMMLCFGDAIHNMRSALDHVAYSFCKADDSKLADHKISFPVGNSRQEFKDKVDKLELSHQVKNCFLGFEAFPLGAGQNILALNKIDNIDKHRIIPLAVTKAILSNVRVRHRNYETGGIIEDVIEPLHFEVMANKQMAGRPTRSGNVVEGIFFGPDHVNRDPRYEIDASKKIVDVDVGLLNPPWPGSTLLDTLNRCYHVVNNVISQLEGVVQQRQGKVFVTDYAVPDWRK